MTSARPYVLLLILLVVVCASLGAHLDCWYMAWPGNRSGSWNPLDVFIGSGQRLFADTFYREADVYYHSGYYPSIYDDREAFQTEHMAADTGAVASHNHGEETGFMGPPLDFIDSFGRHFIPDRHTHLDEGGPSGDLSTSYRVAEILPWLKISSKLDPENVKTYLVMAYWLRAKLSQAADAEKVLRQGLRYNQGNPQLLFELGRIYLDAYHEPDKARAIWQGALRSWTEEKPKVPLADRLKYSVRNFDDRFIFEQLHEYLANVEKQQGNFSAAMADLQMARLASPKPADIQNQINDLKREESAHPSVVRRSSVQ
ncbi:MAG: tetratricopeptide repeat protein [Limisphaerales bacterium]